MKSPAQSPNGLVRFQQGSCRNGTQTANKFWTNDVELSLKKRATIRCLLRRRIPIPRWATLEDIHDVDIVALQAAGFDDFCQQLSGLTDKRFPLSILIGARGFTKENETGVRVSNAKNRLLPRPYQLGTFRTLGNIFRQDLQCGGTLWRRHELWSSRRLGRSAAIPCCCHLPAPALTCSPVTWRAARPSAGW